MQHQRDADHFPDLPEALKVYLRLFGIETVGGADGYRQAIDAGLFHEAPGLLRIGQEGALFINVHIIFDAAEAPQLGLDAAVVEVAEIDHRLHQLHVLRKRKVAAVDHRAAHAGVDLAADIGQRFVVIEVDRQRDFKAAGVGAAQGVDLFKRDVLKGARRAGEDHRRLHFAAHLNDCLNRLGVVDIERRHGVALSLSVLQQIFG